MLEERNNSNTYIAFVDGGSRGNPGPSASAYALFKDCNIRGGEHLVTEGIPLGIQTNNYAEYAAFHDLLAGIPFLEHAPSVLNVFSDSTLMVNQLTGRWATKDEGIQRLQRKIFDKLTPDMKVNVAYIPRAFNKEADKAVNLVLDYQATARLTWESPATSASWFSENLDKLVHDGAFLRLRPVVERGRFFKGGIA